MPQSTSSPTEPRPAPGRAEPQRSGAQGKARGRTQAKAEPRAPGGTQAQPGGWVVYLLRCVDGTLYCGCTNDLERRLGRHRRGDVKYTRGRLPVELAYSEEAGGRGEALRREAALKRLPRGRKLHLCATQARAARPPTEESTREPAQRAGRKPGQKSGQKPGQEPGQKAGRQSVPKAGGRAGRPAGPAASDRPPGDQSDKRRSAAPKL